MVKRWPRAVLIAIAAAVLGAVSPAGQTTVPLDAYPLGGLPDDIEVLRSPGTDPGDWRIQRFDGRATLAQLLSSGGGYQLAVLRSPRLRHLALAVRVRMGEAGDGAAGLAWRVRDADNYFAARLDLADRQFVLYKFIRGNRISLASVGNLRLADTEWHNLVVEHVGERIRVWINGVPIARERDRSLGEGQLGVWMPSDSTAYFTDLHYRELEDD